MDQITSKQLSEWEAFDRIDPIGSWRDDFRLAKIESLITNIVTSLYSKKGNSPVMTTPLDFMVDWSGEEKPGKTKEQIIEEQKQILLSFAKSQNKRVQNDKRKPAIKKQKL